MVNDESGQSQQRSVHVQVHVALGHAALIKFADIVSNHF